MTATSVFACESEPVALEGLERVFERTGEFRLVGSTPDTAAALDLMASIRPRIALVDQVAGWRALLEFLGDLKRVAPGTEAILWVSDLPEANGYRALQVGARGVLRRTLPVAGLLDCLRTVRDGRVWMEGVGETPRNSDGNRPPRPRLTPRERQIVRLVARGMKNREIADELAITAGTVKVHLMHVFEKTGAQDRFQLSVRARGLLGDDTGGQSSGPAG